MQKTNTDLIQDQIISTNILSPQNTHTNMPYNMGAKDKIDRFSHETTAYGYNSSMSGWNAHITFNKFDHDTGIIEKSEAQEEKSAEFQIETQTSFKDPSRNHPQTTKNKSLKNRLNVHVDTETEQIINESQLVLPYLNFIN